MSKLSRAARAVGALPEITRKLNQAKPRLPKRPRNVDANARKAIKDSAAHGTDDLRRARPSDPATPAGPPGATRPRRSLADVIAAARLPERLQRLRPQQWEEVLAYARRNRNRFSVKGILAEQLIEHHDEFAKILATARRRLANSPWDAETIHYARRTRGLAPTVKTNGRFADLADGVLVVYTKNPKGEKKVKIVAVFESKSVSNKGDLVSRGNEELGQLGWDFERFAENPVELEVKLPDGSIERRIFQPDEIDVSRRQTEWRAFIPKGENLKDAARVKQGLPNFDVKNYDIMDSAIQKVADHLVNALNRGDL